MIKIVVYLKLIILPVIDELGGIAIITADHGNAEEMFTVKNGVKTPKTSHTLNPVPFIIYDPQFNDEYTLNASIDGGLANVAATLLTLMDLETPEDYEPSLIELK